MKMKKLKKIKQFIAMFLCVLMVVNVAVPAMATVIASDSNAEEPTQHIVLNTEAEEPTENVCDVCVKDPCECAPVEVCEECGKESCECVPIEVCTECGKEPCECAPVEVCTECGKEPCECVPVEVCEECGEEICECIVCEDCGEKDCTGHEEDIEDASPSDATCQDCGEAPCVCKICKTCGEKNCKEHIKIKLHGTAKLPQIGDKIWIKKGSMVYKTMLGETGWSLIRNYEVEITDIICNEDNEPEWYEFKFTTLGIGEILLRKYKYVRVENTSAEMPDDSEIIEIKSEDGTVGVSGNLPRNAALTVKSVEVNDNVKAEMESALASAVEDDMGAKLMNALGFEDSLAFVYDIKINGGEWQPEEGETVTVTIDGVDAENGQYLRLLHIGSDGITSFVENGAFVNDGKAAFETDGFSTFLGVYDWAGTGKADDPFLIYTVRDLEYMAYCTANGQDLNNCYFELQNNIDLSGSYGAGKADWLPIGGHGIMADDVPVSFKGFFSGNTPGFTISGLYINDEGMWCAGLFGIIGDDAVIRNLTVSGSVTGFQHVGGIIGLVQAEAGSTVTISECINQCTINGKNANTGGIIGAVVSASSILDCENRAQINGNIAVGGIAGYTSVSEIENCKNTAQVLGTGINIGGIIGHADNGTVVKNCENTSDIKDTDTGTYGEINSTNIGGIAGAAVRSEVTGCKNSASVSGAGASGGIVGYSLTSKIKECVNSNYNSIIETLNGYSAGGIVGESWETSVISNGTNYGMVECNVFGMAGGIIGFCRDYLVANPPNGYAPEATVTAAKISYCANLGQITSRGHHIQQWEEESFAGGISGYGGTIYNCWNTGTIKAVVDHGANCPVTNENYHTIEYIQNGKICSAGRYVGGIVAADANVINCWNSGTVSGRDSVAGIIAVNNPRQYQVVNCYNIGRISNDEEVEGRNNAGIMCLAHLIEYESPYNKVTVANCYHAGWAHDTIVQLNLDWIAYNASNLFAKGSSAKYDTIGSDVRHDPNSWVDDLNAYVNNTGFVTVQNGEQIKLETWYAGANGYPIFSFEAGANGTPGVIDPPVPGTYTVTYELNNGAIEGYNQTVEDTKRVKAEPVLNDVGRNLYRVNTYQTEGQQTDVIVISEVQYTFRTWNTKADGTGIDYVAGAPKPPLTEDITLYAQWDLGWGLRYAYVDGVGNIDGSNTGDIPDGLRDPNNMLPIDSQYYMTGDKATVYDYSKVDASHPFNNDFLMGDFGYWTENADGTGVRYYPGEVIEINGNKTLYAVVTYDLTIKNQAEKGEDGEGFLYIVEQKSGIAPFERMTVVVPVNGEVKITDVPAGEYTVTQHTKWSWRYDESVSSSIGDADRTYDSNQIKNKVKVENAVPTANGETVRYYSPDDANATILFENNNRDLIWLSNDCYCENWWDGQNGIIIPNGQYMLVSNNT